MAAGSWPSEADPKRIPSQTALAALGTGFGGARHLFKTVYAAGALRLVRPVLGHSGPHRKSPSRKKNIEKPEVFTYFLGIHDFGLRGHAPKPLKNLVFS